MTTNDTQELFDLMINEHSQGHFKEAEIVAQQLIQMSSDELNFVHLSGAYNVLGVVHFQRGANFQALDYYARAQSYARNANDAVMLAKINGNMGKIYVRLSDYDRALDYTRKSLIYHEESGNTKGIAIDYMTLVSIYSNLHDHNRSLEYSQSALEKFELLQFDAGIVAAMCSVGNALKAQDNPSQALEYYRKALELSERLNHTTYINNLLGSIALAYVDLLDYASAIDYLQRVLTSQSETGDRYMTGVTLRNLASIYSQEKFDGRDIKTAEIFYARSIHHLEQVEAKNELVSVYKELAAFYESQGLWPEAYAYLQKHLALKENVQLDEAKKNSEQLDYERKQTVREKEIAVAQAKHVATESLLHNVLPPSIAQRMLGGEKLIAEKISNVSILFADIVNFTQLSQSISPEELVAGLDLIFSSFDVLAEQYGLEKIKTIGDAYMVVAGAPDAREDHALVMARFALEVMDEMKQFRAITTGEQIQVRIGIHCGEVVAGVIGKKKFAYDMWGDAVNTASRMESQGVAAKVVVSSTFVDAIQSLDEGVSKECIFVPRNAIEIKGKGLMQTYFLERGQ